MMENNKELSENVYTLTKLIRDVYTFGIRLNIF